MANDQANEGAEQNTTQPGQQGEPDKAVENQQAERQRPRIKIGSQRQASGVFRAKPQNVAAPLRLTDDEPASEPVAVPAPTAAAAAPLSSPPPTKVETPAVVSTEPAADAEESTVDKTPAKSFPVRSAATETATPRPIAPPNLRETISENLDEELEAAMGGMALDAMMAAPTAATAATDLEPDSQHRGRVLFVRGSHVFVELGGRNQGLVPITQFELLPKPGDMLEVSVRRFDPAEGLYELSVPDAAVAVGGWDQISEGMVVDAAVTGHNAGGLEVEVNKLRGFIPISQVSLYRVENLSEFVGQRFTCVVTEVNPEARNLVLSRRAMLERERAEAKTKLLEEIDVGQDREGVVTRIQPFGAFVDIGGVDGLVHVSQMSWDRVADPSQVLSVGQRIKVRVVKFDRDTGKIGLSYRESWENPWDKADRKYTPKTKVSGTVSKLTEFGAFVKLEAGIEGLIHISELSHRRVFRASDVVKEGQEVEVLVLSLDKEQQRISLSLKALESRPEPKKKEDEIEEALEAQPVAKRKIQGPLKGGIGGASGGEKFGLKW